MAILEDFLDKPQIFRSEFFKNKYEEKARKNIVNEIEGLKRMKEDALTKAQQA
jgi:predicted metal-dependent HD superfamily phosphohydrolase